MRRSNLRCHVSVLFSFKISPTVNIALPVFFPTSHEIKLRNHPQFICCPELKPIQRHIPKSYSICKSPSPFLFEAVIYKLFIRAVPLVYNTNWTFPNPVHCHLKFLTWTTLNACLIINTGESIRKNLHNGRSEDFSIHDYLISWFLFLINQLIFSVNVWYTTGTHLKCQPFFKPTFCSRNSFHSRLKCSF